jgi:SAM-dependent methyltransferase
MANRNGGDISNIKSKIGSSRHTDADSPEAPAASTIIPVPPPAIHYRVTREEFSDDEYRRRSKELGDGLDTLMAAHGLRMDQFKSVLDFGCGCGRILTNYAHLSETEFHGTDIDEVTVGWCREHIPTMKFSVNGAMPPLYYPDGHFDFVIAISVFTHIPWKMQIEWLKELRRVLHPNGSLLATTHGDFCAEMSLKDESLKAYRETGYCYLRVISDGVLPDWYQSTFVSRDYVQEIFGRIFERVVHVPRGLCNYQDAVILRCE